MPYAMRVYEYGGPEKLRWEQVQVGAPGEGQVLVRNTAVGLNFVDTYQRSGLYPMPLPFTPGVGRRGRGRGGRSQGEGVEGRRPRRLLRARSAPTPRCCCARPTGW